VEDPTQPGVNLEKNASHTKTKSSSSKLISECAPPQIFEKGKQTDKTHQTSHKHMHCKAINEHRELDITGNSDITNTNQACQQVNLCLKFT